MKIEDTLTKPVYGLDELRRVSNLGRTFIYGEINAGRLKVSDYPRMRLSVTRAISLLEKRGEGTIVRRTVVQGVPGAEIRLTVLHATISAFSFFRLLLQTKPTILEARILGWS